MKEDLATTKNVVLFMQGIEKVNTPIRGRIGNMLVFGREGTGKSEVAQWYANKNDIPYMCCRKYISQRELLTKIAGELGEAPEFRTASLFEQIIDILFDNPVPIIVDEVDYLLKGGVVETLRDINDVTNTPIIMVGMGQIDKKLKRFPHLYDRFTSVVRFDLFNESEIRRLADDICDVKLSDCAIRLIAAEGLGKLRVTTEWFARAETLAGHNNLKEVNATHLRTFKGKSR